MSVESLKNNPVVVGAVEVYKVQAKVLLNTMWGNLLVGEEDVSVNQKELELLIEEMADKYYQALDLTFETEERLEKYCNFFIEFQEESGMIKDLTEKSVSNLITEERMMKLFNLV